MHKYIMVYCDNTGDAKEYPVGTMLIDILKDMYPHAPRPIVGALVNNSCKDLNYQIYKPKKVLFIDISHDEGMRMYLRSLIFVMYKGCEDLFPGSRLNIRHPISNGYYCTIEKNNKLLNKDNINELNCRMRRIIEEDIPFLHQEILTEEAIALFSNQRNSSKINLLKTRGSLFTSVYSLGDDIDYFYGKLLPSTGYLKVFDLVAFYNGILLRLPQPGNPSQLQPVVTQKKLLQIFSEHKRWGKIMKARNIGDINNMIHTGEISDLIKITEALQSKKMSMIADRIRKRQKKIKIILISGPSSSGKTTFSKQLDIQLKINGINPIKISLDNYFVNRKDTPLDENGEYDFETIDALDVNFFNQQLLDLLDGKEVEMPKFSFTEGVRFFDGETLSVKKRDLIIIEGIHALNPKLTALIPEEKKFKIYVSALTSVAIDNHNLIKSSDNRLIRRIIRDAKFRGYTAAETIRRWPSVRKGEDLYVFPYQEEADVMFNSALLYELSIFKTYAEPLLLKVQACEPEYYTAQRLLKFFSFFIPLSDIDVPPTSIMKEFLGGSSFYYD